ncbi:MAG: translation elongation factor Ts [Candidatus Edwardsbacteria bacterium]
MVIEASRVKELREKTGAGMMDCKKALEASEGNFEAAIDFLRKQGIAQAERKASRATKEGIIESYIHLGGKLGVLVELNCETDFVAKTAEFRSLAKEIAMQIAAINPISVNRESLPQELIEREKEIYKEQARQTGKAEKVIEKMIEGKMNKFYAEVCLLEQPYIKDPQKTVSNLIKEHIAKLGENITVKRFIRFRLGE